VADARERLFGEVNAGEDLVDPLGQRPLVLVEPADALALPGVLALGVLAELHVSPDRHEVCDVVRQQAEPVAEPALIEQVGFRIEEVLDIGLEPIIGLRARGRSRCILRRLGGKQVSAHMGLLEVCQAAGFAGTGPP
jgi:hypothetical protein